MSWIRKLLGLCEHEFIYVTTRKHTSKTIGKIWNYRDEKWERVEENNESLVNIYYCNKCGKEKTGVKSDKDLTWHKRMILN